MRSPTTAGLLGSVGYAAQVAGGYGRRLEVAFGVTTATLALSTRLWMRRHVVAHSPFVIWVPLSHRRRQSAIASWFIPARFPFGGASGWPVTKRGGSEIFELFGGAVEGVIMLDGLGREAGARLASILGTPVNPTSALGTAAGTGEEAV